MERPYRHEAERRLCGGIPFARPPSFRRRLYAALCGKVFEAGESVGRLAVGALGGTGSPGDANVLCGNGMFGAKIKDEYILP